MLETPMFDRAAVAAPHSLAAQAGKAILAEGGTAIEAMLAMAATIAVVYPHMNAIGGDGFWLIREPGGRVRYIEATGYAGSGATIERYRKLGYDRIPSRGPNAALTVAGAVGGWQLAREMALAAGGKLPLDMLLHDAISHARNGYAVSASEARTEPHERDALLLAPGFAPTFLVDGKPPTAGHIRRMPALADTLAQLAKAGLDDFYRGDVGREIAADLERVDAPVTRSDLERFRAGERLPLSVRLRDCTVYNAPPPTQGLASLIVLGLFERLGIEPGQPFEHMHGLVEATKHAFAVRSRVITDHDHLTEDVSRYLSPDWLDQEAARISMSRAAAHPLVPATGDTIWMGAIDKAGRAVSYIQSIYWEYGSGVVLPRTGVHWQNRGLSFSLDPRSVNPLAPGRRPFHTLNPPLAVFDDGRVMSYGAMGGDGQPQFQAQIFSRYRLGDGLADSIDAPRFLLGATWGAKTTTLQVENRFDGSLVDRLMRVGQNIVVSDDAYADSFGHAGGLVRHQDGRIEAAHDPRADGGAAGL
jgi:gamma-glutamyltranspeptidase/glutathione hydrolase